MRESKEMLVVMTTRPWRGSLTEDRRKIQLTFSLELSHTGLCYFPQLKYCSFRISLVDATRSKICGTGGCDLKTHDLVTCESKAPVRAHGVSRDTLSPNRKRLFSNWSPTSLVMYVVEVFLSGWVVWPVWIKALLLFPNKKHTQNKNYHQSSSFPAES